MNAQTFLEQFAHLAEAPSGIPKLRELVLKLAVRGELAPQDASEAPVSHALGDVQDRKGEHLRARMRGGAQVPRQVQPAEAWINCPAGWEWARIDDTGEYINGLAFKSSQWSDRGLPIVRIQNLTNLDAEFNRAVGPFPDDRIAKDGDILVSWSATLDAFIWDRGDAVVNQHIFKVIPAELIVNTRFLYLLLRAVIRRMADSEHAHGLAMKHINRGPFLAYPVVLPPLAEQKRIVAKVDELMALCDELEAKQQAVRSKQIALNRSSLDALAEANGTGLATAWHRIRDHFDHLYTRPETVAELRQAILQLAVMGRLVPQDPNDEPASEQLRQALQLPEGYTRRRKIQKRTPFSLPDGFFGDVPESWTWESVLDLYDCNAVIDYGDGNHGSLYPRKNEFGESGTTFVTAADIADGKVKWGRCKRLAERRATQLTKGWALGGDVLLTHNATVGRVAIVEEDVGTFLLGTSVTFYRLHPRALAPRYFFYVLMSPVWQDQLRAVMEQTTRNQVSIQKQALFRLPVPPLAEQKRIVAKADQLMTLCDDLEAKLQQSKPDADNLLTAIVHELVGSSSGGRR